MYAKLDATSYVPPPPRALNGGLYTGEPFQQNAPWANVPVVPDVDYMTNVNLRSANPPPGAVFQYPGNTRPGNNFQQNTGLTPFGGKSGEELYNFSCVTCETISSAAAEATAAMKECRCKRMAAISGNFTNQKCECAEYVYVDV
jgi:hypothetical protein